MLKGYTLPLSPNGKAALLDDPPFTFNADYMYIKFKADMKEIRKLLPEPLEPAAEPDAAFACFADYRSVGSGRPELVHTDPELCQYKEASVNLGCQFKDQPGYTIPYIWVTTDFSLIRGWVLGFPKKIGKVFLSKPLAKIGIGTTLGGFVERHGRRLMTASLKITRQAKPEEIPMISFGNRVYLVRHFPSAELGAPPAVHELIQLGIGPEKASRQFGEVGLWAGEATLSFGDSENEELLPLQPKKVLEGYFCNIGWVTRGGKVIHKYV
jgi:acetoacetate decarboxylase